MLVKETEIRLLLNNKLIKYKTNILIFSIKIKLSEDISYINKIDLIKF